MDIATLVKALAPAFASGFALQRLLEILDPILDKIKNGGHKKIILGLISFAAGLALAAWPKIRVLTHLVTDASVPEWLDYLVTALIVSGGTEGFNSIIKFLSYKKEETKASAVNATLDTNLRKTRLEVANAMSNTAASMTSNECLVWRQGEFRKRVRRAVAEWAEEPQANIKPTNTLGELAKHSNWNTGQQVRLVQATNANEVFAPPFPETRMLPPEQLLPASTTVAQWEKIVWARQSPETECFPFTD